MMMGIVAGFPENVELPTAPLDFMFIGPGWDPVLYYNFSWAPPASGGMPAGYRVYMRTNGGPYGLQAEASGTTAQVTGVSGGSTQDFYVTAWNSAGEGPASNVVRMLPS